MITKAYIIEKINTNKYKIEVPIFQKAGIPSTNNTITSNILEATLCYSPGNLDSYSKGDCVFISFENNQRIKPIILGKLYIGNDENATNNVLAKTLQVESSASLPKNTKFGDLSIARIEQLLLELENIKQDIILIKQKIEELEESV